MAIKTEQTEKIIAGIPIITTTFRVGNFESSVVQDFFKGAGLLPGDAGNRVRAYHKARQIGHLNGPYDVTKNGGILFHNAVLNPGNLVVSQTEVQMLGVKIALPTRVTFEKIEFKD